MNNEGWGLNTLLIFIVFLCCFFCISIFIAVRYLGFIIDKDGTWITRNTNNTNNTQIDGSRTYNSMEIDMISGSKAYIKKIYNNVLDDDVLYVRVTSMYDAKVLSKLIDVRDKGIVCTGYVKVYIEDDVKVYKPYLKCGNNYKTDGYISRFDG